MPPEARERTVSETIIADASGTGGKVPSRKRNVNRAPSGDFASLADDDGATLDLGSVQSPPTSPRGSAPAAAPSAPAPAEPVGNLIDF